MKKRRRPLPALPDALKDALHEHALIAAAARRAFAAFLHGVFTKDERDPRAKA